MPDDRTDEQREADSALREAVERCANAYGDVGYVLTEFVVVYARQGWDDEGYQGTEVGTLVDGESTPIHRLLGLCEYAASRYRKLVSE